MNGLRWSLVLVAIGLMVLAFGGLRFHAAAAPQDQSSLIQEIQRSGELRLCVASSRLHSTVDPKTGEWRGLAIEPMRYAAQVMNVKLVTVATTFGDMIPALEARKCDIGGALNMTPARALKVAFAGSYWTDQGAFAYNKQRTGNVDGKKWGAVIDRPGATIAVTEGGAAEQTLHQVIKHAKVLSFPDNNSRDLELISGRVQFVFSDFDDLRYFPQQNSWASVVLPDPEILQQPVGYAVRKGYAYDDIQFFQVLIDNLRGTNQIARWAQQYTGLSK